MKLGDLKVGNPFWALVYKDGDISLSEDGSPVAGLTRRQAKCCLDNSEDRTWMRVKRLVICEHKKDDGQITVDVLKELGFKYSHNLAYWTIRNPHIIEYCPYKKEWWINGVKTHIETISELNTIMKCFRIEKGTK